MEKVFDFLKKISKLAIIIGLFFLALITLVSSISNAPDRFFPFMATSFSGILVAAIYALPAVFLLLKKDDTAKLFLIIALVFLAITNTTTYLGHGILISDIYNTTTILYGIFAFIEGLLLLACLVFFVFVKGFGLKLEKIWNLIITAATAFFVLVFIFGFVRVIDQGSGFDGFLSIFEDTLVVPFVMLLIAVYLSDNKKKIEHQETQE